MAIPRSLALFVAFLIVLLSSNLGAESKPLFEGKSVRIIVGAGVGGTYDIWARILSRHMGKYIAGNPNFIVQNMTGAGSLIASNYVYNVAKPDGLTLLIPNSNIYMDQLMGNKEAQFDARRFNWIGAQTKDHQVLYVRSDSPYTSIDDILKAKEPPKCGASGIGSAGYITPKVIEEITGARFNIILGYQGATDVDMAVEKGELHCKGTTIGAYFAREPYIGWRKKGFVLALAQTPTRKDPRLSEVPTIYDLMERYKTPDVGRRVAKVLAAGGELGNALAAGPAVSVESVKILREAFVSVLKDPDLIAEVNKAKLDMNSCTGEEAQTTMVEALDAQKEVLDRIKTILGK